MPESTSVNLFLVPFGLLVGAYGAIVGAGGGFLIVPILLWTNASPQQAIGTSLLVVFLNAVSGSVSYARKHRIDYHTGVRFAVWVLPGAVGGVFLATLFSRNAFSSIFGVLLLALAAVMIFGPTSSTKRGVHPQRTRLPWWKQRTIREMPDGDGKTLSYSYHTLVGYSLSLFVGFFSSLLGIGGGVIHVPAMIHLLNFPTHIAVATSLFILTLSAGIGAFFHLILGHVLPFTALLIGVGVILGAQLGASLAQRIHGRWLARLLSLGLVVVGIELLIT